VVRALLILVLLAGRLSAQPAATPVERAMDAEARFDTAEALRLYLAALEQDPDNAFLLQKVARQYSDAVDDADSMPERRRLADLALSYAVRATERQPDNPVNVLSVAIAQGKLALASDPAQRIELSRQVRAGAEKALRLDPNYAWAHHVLGRWHFEVTQVRGARRFFARLVYGGLPPASLDEALQHLQRAVELEPEHVLHRAELGFVLEAAGRHQDAREQWRKSLALPRRQKDDAHAQERARQALGDQSTPISESIRPFRAPALVPASAVSRVARLNLESFRLVGPIRPTRNKLVRFFVRPVPGLPCDEDFSLLARG
jgi:tetratricopeptide (TPR) repeat protein